MTSWLQTGPTSVHTVLGTFQNNACAGRVKDAAMTVDGSRIYLAAATGGVWRSDDSGATWTRTMDGFDGAPTTKHSCSLSCGAIAIDPTNSDNVFVGSGEPNWYGGIGVATSSNAGAVWSVEGADAASPSLMGQTCFAMLIDPNAPARLVGVFSNGVYRREPDGMGGYHWVIKLTAPNSNYSDGAVVSAFGVTTFFVADRAAQTIQTSSDGSSWTSLATTGFPTDVGSFVIGTQPSNPNLIYALVPTVDQSTAVLCRLDLPDLQWRTVAGFPLQLFTGQPPRCIAVDPLNANRVFIGSVQIFACAISSTGMGSSLAYSMTTTNVNNNAHNDYHRLRYVGTNSDQLWACGDGGVFFTANATTAVTWQARSIGLATMQPYGMDVHPTQDAVMFIGTQDNGTIRSFGDEVWNGITNMDGGTPVINWANPYNVLAAIDYNLVWRATDGAAAFASWTPVSLPSGSTVAFYPPMVTTPYDPGNPSEADIVAFGANALWITTTFGTSWSSIPTGTPSDDLPIVFGNQEFFSALAFANATRIFGVGSDTSFRQYDYNGTNWQFTDLTHPSALVEFSGVAIDYADPALQSVYAAAYSSYTFEHVFHYDGTSWTARSGPAAGDPHALPDVLFNCIATDPLNPMTLYAGCDIGVWTSTDGGMTWAAMNTGLPQAPITMLKIHKTFRTLYATVYGRGVFEYDLSGTPTPAANLYIRDTLWDTGKRPTVDGLPSPTAPSTPIYHWDGPDICVDAPGPGDTYQFPTPQITPYEFITQLIDESSGTETGSGPIVVNRVYVRVHARGTSTVTDARLTVYLAPCSPTLPDLPAGYAAAVQSGSALSGSSWQLVGSTILPAVSNGYPVVAEFDLPSTMLPPPSMLPGHAHYCLLAMVHSPSLDPFTNTQTHVDTLTLGDRKATNKNLNVVVMGADMAKAPPIGPHWASEWIPIWINGSTQPAGPLALDASAIHGFVDLVVPAALLEHLNPVLRKLENAEILRAFRDAAGHALVELREARKRFHPRYLDEALINLERVIEGKALALRVPSDFREPLTRAFALKPGEQCAFYLRHIANPEPQARTLRTYLVHDGKPLGGITFELRLPAWSAEARTAK